MQTQPSEMVARVAQAMKERAAQPLGNLPSLERVPTGSLGYAWLCLARAAIAAMDDLTRSQWHPIDEHTPRHGNYARVWVEEGLLYAPHNGEATHWMPLKAPD